MDIEVENLSYEERELVEIIGEEKDPAVFIRRKPKSLLFHKKYDVFFGISDFYDVFSVMRKERQYTLKSQAEFIQRHLMPVLKGEIWIDELVKQYRHRKL